MIRNELLIDIATNRYYSMYHLSRALNITSILKLCEFCAIPLSDGVQGSPSGVIGLESRECCRLKREKTSRKKLNQMITS